MNISYRRAEISDAELLIELYNKSFYDDYVKYGECPAYGRTKESMQTSVLNYAKYIIFADEVPVGVCSYTERKEKEYYIGCFCIIPEYQNRGIGTQAFSHIKDLYPDWRRFSLITPSDNKRNLSFYTRKCGFALGKEEIDGNVRVVNLFLER